MPAPSPARKPDAIRCPRDFPRDPKLGRDVARNRLFGPLFGVKRVWNRELTDRPNESLVTPLVNGVDPGLDTLYYAKGHPNEGEHRHEWWIAERRDDGSYAPVMPELGDPAEAGRVKLGYLLPDPYADDERTREAIDAAYEERVREYRGSLEFAERMQALGMEPVVAQEDAPGPRVRPSTAPSSLPVPEAEAEFQERRKDPDAQ